MGISPIKRRILSSQRIFLKIKIRRILSPLGIQVLSSPSKKRKLSYLRGLIAFLVRESNNASFSTLSEYLNRQKSSLSELAEKIERLSTENSFEYRKIRALKDQIQASISNKESIAS
ncbi:MAG: chromosomal replication initiation ATPase DnaA [Chlamydiales bacterium]|jgi:chromosomal replication initiation ATPase DnaA